MLTNRLVCGNMSMEVLFITESEKDTRIAELETENNYLAEENIELARENRELRTIVGYHLTSNRSV